MPHYLYTKEEVAEAMELLRFHRSSIPTECLNQMEEAMLEAIDEA